MRELLAVCATVLAVTACGGEGSPNRDTSNLDQEGWEGISFDGNIKPARLRFRLEESDIHDATGDLLETTATGTAAAGRVLAMTAYSDQGGQQGFPVAYMQLNVSGWQEGEISCADDRGVAFAALRARDDRLTTVYDVDGGEKETRDCQISVDEVVPWDSVRKDPLYQSIKGPLAGERFLVRGRFQARVGPQNDGEAPTAELRGAFDLWDDIQ